jgi:HEAT repeat protein
VLSVRTADPFCGNGVLATINQLADFSHSKTMADLITEGKWRVELLLTLGKVAPPRYANFIGRFRDDPDVSVRKAVAVALGLMDNEAISVPLLIHLLARGDQAEDFLVKWEAANSLVAVARRRGADGVRRRLIELFEDKNGVTVALAARALTGTGDARGLVKLRQLATHSDPRVRQEAVLALGEAADQGARETVTQRLKDDSLAVRTCAVYALGRIGGPSAIPTLRKAVGEALDYEQELDRRKQRGEDPRVLDEKSGRGEFDLRETLQEAIAAAQKAGRRP